MDSKSFVYLFLISLSFAVPKNYANKPGLSKFQFAKDNSARNYRKQDKCGIDVVLNWKKEVQSSCFSTPVVFPLFHERNEDIIVNGFWKYLDVINEKGLSFEGWPISLEDNRFYASPIMYDLNKDGMEDIITIDDSGVIRVVTLSENQSFHHFSTYALPTLPVDRHWFENQLEITDVEAAKKHAHTTLLQALPTIQMKSELEIRQLKEQHKNEQYSHYVTNSFTHVHLDPHIVGDVGKYIDETNLVLLLPISYYLSLDDYPEGFRDVALDKYEACGVTAYDTSTNTVRWSLILGLSTHGSPHRATIFSTPIAVDLEGMGQITTIFGTSQGELYAVNEKGLVRSGFPVHFGAIEMSVVCADITSDSYLEIIVGDLNGNLAVLDYRGEEVWSRVLSGGIAHSVAVGDVDGDGQLDVVALTKNGDLWVLHGQTGESIKYFPIRFGCSCHSSPLLLRFEKTEKGLHIVLISKEGELFIVDGLSGCVNRIDLNEEVYAHILAIRADEQELISLIVATMNSKLIKLTTSGKWDQLNSYTNNDMNMGHVYLPHYNGMYFEDGIKQWVNVMGNHVHLPITIVDQRRNLYNVYYKITVLRKGRILYQNTFYEKGSYDLEFDISETGYFNIGVIFENEHKQLMYTSVNIHANIEALHYLKWIIVIPVIIISTLLFCSSNLGSPLPL